MYKIQTLNSISDTIHTVLTAGHYVISPEEPVPDGILVRSQKMHGMTLPKSLLAVARAGAGVNNIPIEDCTKAGIAVFNTPGANANAVAELVICGLMLAGRNITEGVDWARTLADQGDAVPGLVEKGKGQFVGPEVRGKTLAVIGLGAIGAVVANAASQGLGMNVIGYDPFISVENAWSLSRAVHHVSTLEEAYAQADFITIHIPLTDKTRGFWNAEAFGKMKKGVHLLNFSRAEIADFADLKAALEAGQVGRYVTDFPTAEVLAMPGTICIPHLGASTPESEENCARMAAEELRDYLEFGQIRNSVNLPAMDLSKSASPRILCVHENVPNLLSAITSAVSGFGLNISDLVNRSRGAMAVTAVDLDTLPAENVAALKAAVEAVPCMKRVRILNA